MIEHKSEAKFVKGQWLIEYFSAGNQVEVISECQRYKLHHNKTYGGRGLNEVEIGNAHLIASAPDLYKALESLVFIYEMGGGNSQSLTDCIDFAKSAILKARGD